ncbi:MAG: folylpolyglutamate synthase/dihydrofolate synthase family protein, partial [Candidatus Nanohaloarchaea archaeon]
MGYDEVVDRIYDLEKFRGDIALDPIRKAVARMGDPQEDFASVHVAGTNGKGSTATILASVLQEAGYTTGLFTSPHLVDFRERMRVDGEKITKDEVVERFSSVESTDVELSFFEAMTAMAFDHFSREDVDVAVVETGMGGEVDATNVIQPEASVITNVAREHTKWLGESREEIAGKLAGVVKEGTPVVSGAEGDARKVIREAA